MKTNYVKFLTNLFFFHKTICLQTEFIQKWASFVFSLQILYSWIMLKFRCHLEVSEATASKVPLLVVVAHQRRATALFRFIVVTWFSRSQLSWTNFCDKTDYCLGFRFTIISKPFFNLIEFKTLQYNGNINISFLFHIN